MVPPKSAWFQANQTIAIGYMELGIIFIRAKIAFPEARVSDGEAIQESAVAMSRYTGGQAPGGTVIPGTKITVYRSDGTLLYSYTTTATNGPAVRTGSVFNTGYTPYLLAPIYNGASPSGLGTTIFSS
jgi:hypothetical protein